MRDRLKRVILVVVLLGSPVVVADETDQFMSWGVELRDSADITNATFNRMVREAIALRNGAIEPPCDCPSMAVNAFDYVFNGRLTSRFMKELDANEDIDVYPPRSVSRMKYQQMSIYRGIVFPFVLPMSRTVRVGDIYFGTDKWGHFLGLGRRYYKHYLWYRENNISEDEAVEMTLQWGVLSENTIVGKVVDGIFSHADLEANYQGFLLARDMCEGVSPYIVRGENGWELAHEIDLRDYVTPYWDESYNPSHYWGRRRQLVMPVLREEYAAKAHTPEVMARFHAYEQHPPSESVEFVRHYFLDRGRTPQRDQTFSALSLQPGYPSTLFAAGPVP